MAALLTFDFPSNVRQLENFCHWLTVMAPGQTIEPGDLPPEIRAGGIAVAVTSVKAAPAGATMSSAPASSSADALQGEWHDALVLDARQRLERGEPAVMATLTRQFEKILLQSALDASRGRRVEATTRPGIGRNTITRKLRELGMSEE